MSSKTPLWSRRIGRAEEPYIRYFDTLCVGWHWAQIDGCGPCQNSRQPCGGSQTGHSRGPPLALARHIPPPIKGAKHDPPRRHVHRLCSPPLGRRPSFRPRLSPRLAVHPSRGLAQSRPQMSAARTFLGLTRAKQLSKRPEREPDKFKMNAQRGDSLVAFARRAQTSAPATSRPQWGRSATPEREAYVPPLSVVVQQLDAARPARLVSTPEFWGSAQPRPHGSGHFGQHPQWELPHRQWELPHRREARRIYPWVPAGQAGPTRSRNLFANGLLAVDRHGLQNVLSSQRTVFEVTRSDRDPSGGVFRCRNGPNCKSVRISLRRSAALGRPVCLWAWRGLSSESLSWIPSRRLFVPTGLLRSLRVRTAARLPSASPSGRGG